MNSTKPTLARRAARALSVVLATQLLAATAAAHNGVDHARTRPAAPPPDAALAAPLNIELPDVTVVDQHGTPHRLASELARGRTLVVSFIFTSCTSVCSPMTAIVRSAREALGARGRDEVLFLSVSVDPLNDTPARLAAYAQKMQATGEDWRFVTGTRKAVEAIQRAFGVPTGGSLDDHSPMVFVGHVPTRRWTRAYGLAQPQAITDRILALLPRKAAEAVAPQQHAATPRHVSLRAPEAPATPVPAVSPAASEPQNGPGMERLRAAAAQHARGAQATQLGARDAAAYFTNLPLLTHRGQRVRFYDDLIKGRVVLVNAFFASCKDVCSPVGHNLAQAQRQLAAAAGLPPVQLVSLSVDPVADTPELLADYARRHNAQPGWHFVTGKKENVDWVLHKLGLYVPDKEQHQAALWIGNDRTSTWLKLHALAPPEAIVAAVRKVL